MSPDVSTIHSCSALLGSGRVRGMVADPECQQLGVGAHSEQLGDPKKEKEET